MAVSTQTFTVAHGCQLCVGGAALPRIPFVLASPESRKTHSESLSHSRAVCVWPVWLWDWPLERPWVPGASAVPPDGHRLLVPQRNLFTCGGATNNENVCVQLNNFLLSRQAHNKNRPKGDVVDTYNRFIFVIVAVQGVLHQAFCNWVFHNNFSPSHWPLQSV